MSPFARADVMRGGRPPADSAEGIALAMLEEAAGGGRPCPKNDAIAEAIGAKSIATAARVVATLERLGLIAVERGHKSRVVTIAASGARTGATEATTGPKRADELAELVAEGATLAAAARAMGLSEARVHQIWAWIRARLGPQAT